MTPNQWNRNIRDSVVSLLKQAGFSEDSSVINQLECMNFDAPAAPQSDTARYELLRARFDDCKSSQCGLMQEFLKLDGEPHESLDVLIDRALQKEEN